MAKGKKGSLHRLRSKVAKGKRKRGRTRKTKRAKGKYSPGAHLDVWAGGINFGRPGYKVDPVTGVATSRMLGERMQAVQNQTQSHLHKLSPDKKGLKVHSRKKGLKHRRDKRTKKRKEKRLHEATYKRKQPKSGEDVVRKVWPMTSFKPYEKKKKSSVSKKKSKSKSKSKSKGRSM